MCAGGLFVVFKLWFGGLCFLLEHSFVSDVSSRCPCLRVLRLVFFRRSFLLPLFWLSIAYWSFFIFVSFLFLFSRVTICVLSMHSSTGRLRTMCGSRPVDVRFLV
jgi:hypothetical protein